MSGDENVGADFDDDWMDDIEWDDDDNIICGVENPESCESCQ